MNTNAVISVALNLVMPIIVTCAVLLNPLNESWLVSFLLACFLCPLAAAFFGHAAKREIRKNNIDRNIWSRMATAGLIIGYLELAFFVLVGVTSGHRPSRIVASEAVAVGSLRSLNSAAHAFAAAHPEQGFPKTLADLHWNGLQPQPDWTIDAALESGVRARYRFAYIVKNTSRDGVVDAYQVFADPIEPGARDWQYFFTDQSGVIRAAFGVRANESSEGLQ